ncbi:uncharacterized protein BDV17DRAFT_214963 [Aspergillus undulatus]|uniref:uncharacterized protein n=1 Tax=Aspergillus undulatus TaxID=1810928 RepID=UPI003CCDCE78
MSDVCVTRTDTLNIIRQELDEAMEWGDYPDRAFVTLRDFDGFLQTLSILVWIYWDEWTRFHDIFMAHPVRSDGDIFSNEWKSETSELGLGTFTDRFLEARSIFCPIDLVEGENLEISQHRVLPFLEAYADVFDGRF